MLRIINFINQENLEDLQFYLKQNHFQIFEINGATVKDQETFFIEVIKKLPQDPDLAPPPVGNCSWDAFSDSLIGGLANRESKDVAIVWTQVENILECGLPDFTIALSCFEQTILTVAHAKYGFPHRMRLLIFLIGKGCNFRPFNETINNAVQ